MKYEIQHHHSTGKNFQRIDKKEAKKCFEAGHTVYLIPCNCTFNNMWVSLCPIKKSENDESFNHIVLDFKYYNCCYELGYYPHYYVEAN